MKKILIITLFALSVAACAPVTPPPDTAVTSPPGVDLTPQLPPATSPFSPLPGDSNLERGNVFVSKSDLLIRESYPVQIALVLGGELPSPCHQLRVSVNPPDTENKIFIEVYTVYNPNTNCIQVLKPFEETVELGTFPNGHYTVWVNETQVGEFDA